MATLRTFLAVEAPAAMRTRAGGLIDALAGTPANVKWVDDESLHWTLKFLGDVQSRDIPQVCQAVTKAVAGLAPFDVHARGAGAFPTAERPRTVWLGVDSGEEAIVALHDAIEERLADLGFRREQRRYRPHLTLGRVRRSQMGIADLGELIALHDEYDAGTMRVDEVVIFSSQLERSGPSYEVLGRAPLGS